MPDLWYEWDGVDTLTPLNLLGEYVDEDTGVKALQVSQVGDPQPPQVPTAPTLSGSLTSRTVSAISWVQGDDTDRPRVIEWDVERRSSTNNGSSYGSWAAISGSPFSAATLSAGESGLSVQTSPEVLFQYRVRGVNDDGDGDWSNVLALQWAGTPAQVPTAPTSLTRTGLAPTQVILHWAETADASVTKHGIWRNNTLLVDNIDKAALDYTWTGLTPGTAYANINVRRANADGWSPASNNITFNTPVTPVPSFTMLMGASVPDRQPMPPEGVAGQTQWPPWSGGQTQWDAIRVYDFGDAITEFNQWDPKVIGLTDSNTAIQGGASSATALRNFLEDFYYPSGTYNSRNGCEIHFANGNEYGNNVTNVANFVDTVRRMSLVINEAGSQTGGRRYPLASMWLDPTHYQENQKPANYLESIMQSAPYLDGCAWSMYPPGRQPNHSNPTFTKPTLTATSTGGFLERCFQRTKLMSQASTNTYLGGVDNPLKIAIWEIGIGDDPNDRDHRPYYVAHSIASWCYERCLDPDMQMEMPVALWWDQQKDSTNSPENVLSNEPSTTSPSTAEAWKNWRAYMPEYGGTKPSNWPDAPKSTWPTGA